MMASGTGLDVVKESLDDVHSALASGQITDIRFGWAKFRISSVLEQDSTLL